MGYVKGPLPGTIRREPQEYSRNIMRIHGARVNPKTYYVLTVFLGFHVWTPPFKYFILVDVTETALGFRVFFLLGESWGLK